MVEAPHMTVAAATAALTTTAVRRSMGIDLDLGSEWWRAPARGPVPSHRRVLRPT